MTASTAKHKTTLTDLPPELCLHIATYLPTATSVASLARTNKSLNVSIEKDAWKSFCKIRFPSSCPETTPSYKDTARTLTTLSKAWDRRAFVARYTEPRDSITSFPGRKKIKTWTRPRGQTIGFTPQLDVYETIGSRWEDRNEVLAFSAGAQICLRHTIRGDGEVDEKWTTYRPLSAQEGRDDVTAMHLLRPQKDDYDDRQKMITGTANGDLQLLTMPDPEDEYDQDVRITYFATQGLPVRSTSVLQQANLPALLAANLGDARVVLYGVDTEKPKIVPSCQFDMKPVLRSNGQPASGHRAWTTTFLSPSSLAVGTGPSEDPIHIYPIIASGLERDAVRKVSLRNTFDQLDVGSASNGAPKPHHSSIYTLVPLPSSTGSKGDGTVFLTGAYDGFIRLHDLRSNVEVEQSYADPADDSAIYSILPRGQESFLAGTSRHNLLKIFDLRQGVKAYSYLDAHSQPHDGLAKDYNIFLRPTPQSFTARASNTRSRPQRESSIYTLSSPSSHSPYIYAGVENAMMSLAFTSLLDPHPDPVFFAPWTSAGEKAGILTGKSFESKDVLGLAMYEHGNAMKLCTQRSPWETWRAQGGGGRGRRMEGRLDERWKGANEFGP